MRLYDAQIAQIAEFDERGYLFFPGLLEADEAQILQDEMPELLARQGPEVMRERGEECAARLVFGAYQFSEAFRLLTQLPRMLLPVRQLLRDQVYLHQSRLNPQEGFGKGGQWEWHQDFGPWHRLDDMSEPRCIMAAVFVDDCSVAQSPLMVVPGTHRLGYLESIQPDTAAGGAAVPPDEEPASHRLRRPSATADPIVATRATRRGGGPRRPARSARRCACAGPSRPLF